MQVPFRDLWLPTLCVIIFGTVILERMMGVKRSVALPLSLVKAAIPFVFFAYFYDGAWNLFDDIIYFELGNLLSAQGQNPFLILFRSDGRNLIMSTAGGTHILYVWWNLLAVDVFGSSYSSPVFMNVATTFVSAALLSKMATDSGCDRTYAKWFGLFFLFHPDVLCWSSFVNVKDNLVLLLTLVTAYAAMRVIVLHRMWNLVLLAGSSIGLVWIRYYDPVLMLLSAVAWAVLAVKGWQKALWLFVTIGGLYVVFPAGSFQKFQYLSTGDWLLGPIRMVLTPQPWSILPSASFLLIPAWFHWTFILPALVAGYILFRRNLWFRYGAIYYATCILFYGLIPDLAGPRQRYQAVWAMAWAQFHFAWILAHLSQKKVGSSRKESAVITLPPRLVKAYGPSDPSNNWLRGRRRRENLK